MLAIVLPARGSRSLTHALHGQLLAAIRAGRLAPGLRLPATRALAQHLGISRNSVIAAYELLAVQRVRQRARSARRQRDRQHRKWILCFHEMWRCWSSACLRIVTTSQHRKLP